MNTGDIIKFLRKKFNLTQDELAIKLRVNKSSVQKYESGVVQNLKMETIRDLCELFKVSPVVFIFPEQIENLKLMEPMMLTNSVNLSHLTIMAAKLNDEGRQKALEYVRDLADSGNYKPVQDSSR